MEYIIINLLTISLFTYIVYIVANKILAIKMHIKFLILCACCSLLINLIFPRIFVSFAGLTGTLGIIILFAIISSYCIAYYYDNTMGKVALKHALTTNSLEVPETLQADKQELIQLISNLKNACPGCWVANEHVKQRDHIVVVATCDCCLELKGVIHSDDLNKAIQLNNNVEIIENTTVITEFVTKKYFYPIKYAEGNKNLVVLENNRQQHKPERLLNSAVEIDKGAKAFISNMNFKNKVDILRTPCMLEAIHNHLDVPISKELPINCTEKIDKNSEVKTVAEDDYPCSNDLDILMDFAFLQKEKRNFPQALIFFRQALRLYPDSEAGPFLVMEVGTILKNIGSYNEAIEVFAEGRLLPRVINNAMLEQEFINNIAYLRIVKNILIQNSLEFMPFNRIPENAFNEIDSEFCEWRNQS